MRRAVIVGASLGVAATLLAVLLSQTALARRFEDASYDFRVLHSASPVDPSSPIVLVEINDSSIRELDEKAKIGRWPWPRLVHASAIDYLTRSGAKVVAYDILFTESDRSEVVVNGRRIAGTESDQALVDSVRRAGNVVMLADATLNPLASDTKETRVAANSGFQYRPRLLRPAGDLSAAAAAIGHNYLAKDEGSDAARRVLPFIQYDNGTVPSLGVAAALLFSETPQSAVRIEADVLRLADARVPLLADPTPEGAPSRQVLFRLPRPVEGNDGVRTTYPTYSFYDVVLSEDNVLSGKAPAIPASAFAGKIVFVGTTAAGLHDRYATPFLGGVAGVELHATLADNILANRFMKRSSPVVDVTLALAAGVFAGLAATIMPVAAAVGVVIAGAGGLGWWLTARVGGGTWDAAVMPAASMAIALFAGVGWRYLVADRGKREMRRMFGRYVSNDVIDELIANPDLVRLGGQRREMTVLFSDIRGFTTASERHPPEAVVSQLNEYFGAMVEVLFRHHGTLDKFVGDMVMGLFGAPLADAAHADHAVAAALDMTRTLEALNERWRREGRPVLDIGIGINSGEMIAGNIGSETIMSYTVIGDAVNLGSRLESLNKDYGTHILISEATRSRLTLPVETRKIGDITVKGKTQAVTVYEVIGRKELTT